MTSGLILALDQGTTNAKAVLIDTEGRVVAEAGVPVPLVFPRPGWAETDATAVWRSLESAAAAALQGVDSGELVAIALTNQRESVVAWDRRTGGALGPCISWQCRRTEAACEALRERGLEPLLRERTGLGIDPLFSATKARWLLDRIDDAPRRARDGELAIGTVDAWILWNLTGGRSFATDLTNASRTQLLDLATGRWDDELLAVFGIPSTVLPAIEASSSRFGVSAGVGPFPAGVPIGALIGDSHAALFGHGAPAVGAVKATYGTGTSVMAPVDRPTLVEGLSTTIAWSIEAAAGVPPAIVYALEGNVTVTGAGLDWLAAILGVDDGVAGLLALAATVEGADGTYLVPAFAGLGAPHWDAGARGLVSGLTRGTSRAHLARAAVDAIAYQVRDVLDVMAGALAHPVEALYADGGAMRSDLLATTQADIAGVPVLRSRSVNLSALGAAYLAGLAAGVWGNVDEIRELPRGIDRFAPTLPTDERERGYQGWRDAVGRATTDRPRRAAAVAAGR